MDVKTNNFFRKNNKNKGQTQQTEKQLNQVNELIQMANQAIMCGPDCQNKKNVDELQQKYLNAQTNLATAPQQLTLAEKNYYVAFKGSAYYNDFLSKELQGKADLMGNSISSIFQQNIEHTKQLSNLYDTLDTNFKNMLEFVNKYVTSNENLNDKFTGVKQDIVTNDRKTYYEYEEYTMMKNWYYFFKWIYIILIVVFIVASFLIPNPYSLKYKFFLLALFILYPFVIDYIIIWVIHFFVRIYELLPTNIYTKL